jgi:hypothetical protein
MPLYAKVRTDAVIFNPSAVSEMPNNSLFVDQSTGILKTKSSTGIVTDLTGSANIFAKEMQSAAAIRVGKPVSKRSDGRIEEAESDSIHGQMPIGFATVAFSGPNQIGTVFLVGPNLSGLVTGMGFAPGEEIYIGETSGGLTNSIANFSGNDDSYIRLGIADCTAGIASSTANDLILSMQIIARP